MNKKNDKPRVGIFTPPLLLAGITPLSNLIDVIYPNATDLYLITGKAGYDRFKDDKRVRIYEFQPSGSIRVPGHLIIRALRFVYAQIAASYKVAKVGKNVDSWIFFMGADFFPLAVLAARMRGRAVFILMSGNFLDPSVAVAASDFPKITTPLYKASHLLSNHIVLYSDFIEEWDLEKYREKIIIAQRHFVNFDEFRLKINLELRDNVVGYVGRLSAEKGIRNFVEAIPKALVMRPDMKFLIIGEGPLQDEIRISLEKYAVDSEVKLTAWIPHSELPDFLNQLKLLVIPSYTESGPMILFEAMACGTPVLATAVGSIPDAINDKETGFLLQDNSPPRIAKQIEEALSDPNLEQIAVNARNLVQSKYSYERVVKIWANVLRTIEKDA